MIPLFPLNVVVCPNEPLSLHIFEERYKEMITLCIQESRPFGVILVHESSLKNVGCTVGIAEVNKVYSDGRMDIKTVGIQRFNIVSIDRRKSFLQASVSYFEDEAPEADSELKSKVIELHRELLTVAKAAVDETIYSHPQTSFIISHSAGLELLDKQSLLEMRSENERLKFLEIHFHEVIAKIKHYEELKNLIHSNGHYKKFPPTDINLLG